ncbi:hypothetical protein SIN8267_02396 [Sinobacterium norvegicum]|uniref:Transport permease protein n=1 Tax=Sinobacterium norvegicum TaxID=1641715 RepID=A0ABN8ELJ7_9GAMM|nr:ABC transporter permease [Sinobacterium norvegicum]CAH0992277.1 hypothetical protein SIN8267_02396 [Sinobacterium norvegicum]
MKVNAQIQSLISYRGFIRGSVRREFDAKYRNGSLLGILWSILTPLSTIVIYVVIFTSLMQARLEGVDNSFAYGIYICSGVLTWGVFAEVINRCRTMFIDNANMLKKLSFPRLCLPIIIVSSSLLNFCIVMFLFFIFLMLSGLWPNFSLFALLPLLMLQLLLAVSLGVILGVLNVFFRDVGQLSGILMQFWFWFTPIVYPISILPDVVKQFILLNPMTHIIAGYQDIFVFNRWPSLDTLIMPLLVAIGLFVIALMLFKRRGGEMVDEL